jgi:tyrosine-protein kinase Etk/Wzc
MDHTHISKVEAQTTPAQAEISLGEFLREVVLKKKTVLVVTAAAAVLSIAVSLLLPNIYKATTKLLPPQQAQSSATALLSQLGGVAGMAAGVAGLKSPNEMYIGMLKSRTVADRLINQFDLKQVYGVELQEEARKKLEDNTSITSGKDGLISIDVEDKDKKLVVNLANTYVSELFRLSRVLAVTEASQRRVFFERQLEQAKNNLSTAEVQLKKAFDTRGVISVDVESRAIVETIAKIKAQISVKEIQLNAMASFITSSNPDYKRVEEELISLRKELARLENGRPQADETIDSSGKATQGLENIKLLRDVKYYQMLYELLAKQYEVARLDEAKDPSIIQVLDPAVEPERKFKPKRSLIVILSTLIGFLSSLAWIFLALTVNRARNGRADISMKNTDVLHPVDEYSH